MQFWPVRQQTPVIPENFAQIARPQTAGLPSSFAQQIPTPQPTTPQPTAPTLPKLTTVTPFESMWWPVPWGSQMWWFPTKVNIEWLLDKVIKSKKATTKDIDIMLKQMKDRTQAEWLLNSLQDQWVKLEAPKKSVFEQAREWLWKFEEIIWKTPVTWLAGESVFPKIVWWWIDVLEAWSKTIATLPDIYKKRATKAKDSLLAEDWNILQNATQAFFQWLWIWTDVAWEAFIQWLKAVDKNAWNIWEKWLKAIQNWVMTLLNTPKWQQLVQNLEQLSDNYDEYVKNNPEEWRNLDAFAVAIELWLELVWAWVWSRATKTSLRWAEEALWALWRWIPTPTTPPKQAFEAAVQRLWAEEYVNITKIANTAWLNTSFYDKAVWEFTGLDPATVKKMRDNRSLVVLWDMQSWDRENTIQHTLDTVKNAKERFGSAWAAYEAVKQSWNNASVYNLQSNLDQFLSKENIKVTTTEEWIAITFPATSKFTKWEQSTIRNAILPFYQLQQDIINPEEFLNMRSALTNYAWFDVTGKRTKKARDYVKAIRAELNRNVRKEFPWLEETDRIYMKLHDELDDVTEMFFKDGEQTTNVYNKVKSILNEPESNPKRQALLRAVPDIEDRMLYLDIMTDIWRTAWSQKTWRYLASIWLPVIWASVWWVFGTVLWAFLWFAIQTPDVIRSLLLKWWMPKEAAIRIAKKIWKQEALLKSEAAMIRSAIQRANERPALPAPDVSPMPITPEWDVLLDWRLPTRQTFFPFWEPPAPRQVTEIWFPEFTQWPINQARQQSIIAEQMKKIEAERIAAQKAARIEELNRVFQEAEWEIVTDVRFFKPWMITKDWVIIEAWFNRAVPFYRVEWDPNYFYSRTSWIAKKVENPKLSAWDQIIQEEEARQLSWPKTNSKTNDRAAMLRKQMSQKWRMNERISGGMDMFWIDDIEDLTDDELILFSELVNARKYDDEFWAKSDKLIDMLEQRRWPTPWNPRTSK
jgi:hypothetical protein